MPRPTQELMASGQPGPQQRQAQADHIGVATIEAFNAATASTFKGKATSALQWLSSGDIGLNLIVRESGKQHAGGDTTAQWLCLFSG